jgi:hypothetical protein
MKKIGISLLIILMSLCMFTACNLFGEEEEETGSAGQGKTIEESVEDKIEEGQMEDEDEAFELKTKKVDDSFFVGHWVAEGEKAEYMYGNVDIIIREDGTWDGNITEEEIHGKWTREGDGIRLTSDVIPFNMVYSTNNNVILQETDDAVRVVLTKK